MNSHCALISLNESHKLASDRAQEGEISKKREFP